jgi:hypothetical protein
MKLSNQQIQTLAQQILSAWVSSSVVELKADEKKILDRIVKSIQADVQREADLDREVNKMLDDLERSHGGEFQRYKMFPMLKTKLAKERKIVL